MGEVYQARDVTLLRDVAVKILPGTPATDAVRVARFQQEARILASLNHPHIAQIYGFDHANGLSFLALELVEGESLAERIRRGPLKLSDAVELTRQIAEALDAAHERGIIHRDLKPANVMITRAGAVKLLDFGVAKVLASSDDAAETIAAETRAGSLIGTVAYMSPEQARADAVDKRADVWAFGCIVFEMLTATQAFPGRSSADVLAAILHNEPDWRLLPASVPTSVERLLRHCLTKDWRRRLRDIGDALFELESAGDGVGFSGGQTTRARWLAAVAVTAVTALGAGVLLGRRLAPASSGRAEGGSGGRFSIALPEGEHLASLEMPAVAISADGRRVAFVAGDTTARLFVRELDQPSGRLLAGTDGAASPFFSPDGRSVGFFAGGRLKRVSIDGGDVVTVCGGASNPRGGAWNIDGTIAFAPAPGSALVQVDANGGQPRPLTTLDSNAWRGGAALARIPARRRCDHLHLRNRHRVFLGRPRHRPRVARDASAAHHRPWIFGEVRRVRASRRRAWRSADDAAVQFATAAGDRRSGSGGGRRHAIGVRCVTVQRVPRWIVRHRAGRPERAGARVDITKRRR